MNVSGKRAPSLDDDLARLRCEHKDGLHVYRGQTRRWPRHSWRDRSGVTHDLESLYPADYRFMTGFREWVPGFDGQITSTRDEGRNTRGDFAHFLLTEAYRADPRFAWLAPHRAQYQALIRSALRRSPWLCLRLLLARRTSSLMHQLDYKQFASRHTKFAHDWHQQVGVFLNELSYYQVAWFLAQHYLVSTALLDVTFVVDVAAWFATHPWDATSPLPGTGCGVIHRFNRNLLEPLLLSYNDWKRKYAAERGILPGPDCFLIDIRDIPTCFAKRPAHQRGGSIYGFDQVSVVQKSFELNCVEAFAFRHTGIEPTLSVTRSFLIPEEDPFLPILEAFKARVRSLSARPS